MFFSSYLHRQGKRPYGPTRFIPPAGGHKVHLTQSRKITASSFDYSKDTVRKKWERWYLNYTKKYGLGLEVAYIDENGYYNEAQTRLLISKRILDNLGPPSLSKETRGFLHTWRLHTLGGTKK